MRVYTAVLKGGPAEGRKVEMLGVRYEVSRSRPRRRWSFFKAVYEWDREPDGSFVGRFKGYFDGARRVDKLGRRMPQRERAKARLSSRPS